MTLYFNNHTLSQPIFIQNKVYANMIILSLIKPFSLKDWTQEIPLWVK